MTRSIEDLHPNLRNKCLKHLKKCQDNDIDAFVTHTWRSPSEQDELYAQGRTKPGKIVTYLKSDRSKHCFMIGATPAAKAYDIMIKNEDGSLINDGDHVKYRKAAEYGKELGLECGFFWKKFRDSGHYELKED